MGETVERVQDPAMDDSPNAGDPQAAAASQICVALSPVIQGTELLLSPPYPPNPSQPAPHGRGHAP